MPNYGVIDLGSNTVRLCVYRVFNEGKKLPEGDRGFRSLLNNKVVAGLSAYVVDGKFTEQGIKRTINVLKGHHKRLKYFECERTDVFATAVLRNCSNSDEVVKEIERQSGFTINLLSGEDEAHLGFVGATCEYPIEHGTLVDIGGGSTELTRVHKGRDHHNMSFGQGSLSSFTACVSSILPTPKEMDAIRKLLDKNLRSIKHLKEYEHHTFYGIGGSLRGASKIFSELLEEGVDLDPFTPNTFEAFFKLYRKDPDMVAHAILKAVPERIHTIIPGCLIAAQLMETLGGKTIELRKKGVREGYLIERILAER